MGIRRWRPIIRFPRSSGGLPLPPSFVLRDGGTVRRCVVARPIVPSPVCPFFPLLSVSILNQPSLRRPADLLATIVASGFVVRRRRPGGVRGFARFAVGVAALVIGGLPTAMACPFCNAVSQTLRQEMAAMDAVAIATSVDSDATRPVAEGDVMMRIDEVLKGPELIAPGQVIETVYYGSVDNDRQFMLSGVDPPELLWSSVPLSEAAAKYLREIPKLPDDAVSRLKYYYDFLQSDDPMLARDAYDEFAIAPYDDIRALAPNIDRQDLRDWLGHPDLPTDRKRLYMTLLGVVGDENDLPMLEQMLRSTQKSTRGGLDATIACYLTLAGEKGLPLIEELFLNNPKASYTDTYAAVMAIRFHGTEGEVIARSALTESLHYLLEREELADLIIPDLARWKDWSQIDAVVKLFKESDPENNWVRVPVVNYLRACPLPKAAEALDELKALDPESIRRANSYFSIPVPQAETPADQSSWMPKRTASSSDVVVATVRGAVGRRLAFRRQASDVALGSLVAGKIGDGTPKAASLVAVQSSPANFGTHFIVVAIAAATLILAMHLVLVGGAAGGDPS